MIRTYATPIAFKEALEARLRERAQRDGRPINRVRQLVVMERFLARVFAGFDSAVLKGGMVMELRLERARSTKDLDLRLNGRANEILDRLQAAGRSDLLDFLSFEVRADAAHPVIEADGLLYEGQRFRRTCRISRCWPGVPRLTRRSWSPPSKRPSPTVGRTRCPRRSPTRRRSGRPCTGAWRRRSDSTGRISLSSSTRCGRSWTRRLPGGAASGIRPNGRGPTPTGDGIRTRTTEFRGR